MNAQQVTLLVSILFFVVDLAIKIAALIIIPRDRKPTAAMAWLLAIFFIPYVGILFFLILGSAKLPKKRREKQVQIDAMIASAVPRVDLVSDRSTWAPWLENVTVMNQNLGAVPMIGGNTAHLIDDYNGGIVTMAAEIDTATTFVHVEYFIVSFDSVTKPFFTAMENAVARGVTVRLLADHISSKKVAHSAETFAELDRIGVKWSYMLPVMPFKGKYQRPDLRNHRKLVVVDGRVAFMGSQNLIDRSYNSPKNIKRGLQWQELITRLTGPAVSGINAVFLSDWYMETDEIIENDRVSPTALESATGPTALDCQIVPSGPGYEGENNLQLFLALLYSAQKKVIITSPYFVPNEAMLYAIIAARKRGLEVQLFVSAIGDQVPVFHAQRSYYRPLLEAGVQIWRYPAPYILHAKHLSIDDDIAVIGSSNMDIRSFLLDLEISMLVRGQSFVAEMRAVEAHYREIGSLLTLDEWNREPLKSTALDGLARLTSALE
ncbi:cardiolipin synthase [Subtercola sp. YIM 133946]|uniref:cardiolipin synthase n=1 Tax=Subtercola sp. YIM 133946 TaxID=3118909 RepID=UPI002F924FED